MRAKNIYNLDGELDESGTIVVCLWQSNIKEYSLTIVDCTARAVYNQVVQNQIESGEHSSFNPRRYLIERIVYKTNSKRIANAFLVHWLKSRRRMRSLIGLYYSNRIQ